MRALRRHLASLGLAVALCHVVIQVCMTAALCCQPSDAARKLAPAADCCPAGSHPGQICPMHANRMKAADSSKCHAQPLVDLHDLYVALNSGGVVPGLAAIAAPGGSEAAPPAVSSTAVDYLSPPLGPPPRA